MGRCREVVEQLVMNHPAAALASYDRHRACMRCVPVFPTNVDLFALRPSPAIESPRSKRQPWSNVAQTRLLVLSPHGPRRYLAVAMRAPFWLRRTLRGPLACATRRQIRKEPNVPRAYRGDGRAASWSPPRRAYRTAASIDVRDIRWPFGPWNRRPGCAFGADSAPPPCGKGWLPQKACLPAESRNWPTSYA